jgi:hypothetical protein
MSLQIPTAGRVSPASAIFTKEPDYTFQEMAARISLAAGYTPLSFAIANPKALDIIAPDEPLGRLKAGFSVFFGGISTPAVALHAAKATSDVAKKRFHFENKNANALGGFVGGFLGVSTPLVIYSAITQTALSHEMILTGSLIAGGVVGGTARIATAYFENSQPPTAIPEPIFPAQIYH